MQNNQEVPWEKGVRKGGKMDKAVMHANLLDFRRAMAEAKIPFVFIFGALLGLTRENKLIDWDSDVDVFCDSKYHRNIGKVVNKLKEQGFFIPCGNVCPLHDTFFIRNGEKIEIWWFDEIDDEYVYDNKVRYPKEYFKKTDRIYFLDNDWLVPCKRWDFLNITYGEDWRIPDPNKEYILGRNR